MDMGFNLWSLTAAQRELLIPVKVPDPPDPKARKEKLHLLSMDEMQARTDRLLASQGASDGVTPA